MVGQYDVIFICTKWTQTERRQLTVYYTKVKERLNTQLNESTNQNSLKLQKVLSNGKENVFIKLWGLVL